LSIPQISEVCKREGFKHIELSSGIRWSEAVVEEAFAAQREGLKCLIHNYFPPHRDAFVLNLASLDRQTLERSREHCAAAIDLCAELGAPFYSVHSGFAADAKVEHLGNSLTRAKAYPRERAQDIFVESLGFLCRRAEARSLRLLIENNVVAPPNLVEGENKFLLVTTAEEYLATYDAVASPALGLLVDVAHLKITAATLDFDALKYLDQVSSHIVAFHLSETDGLKDRNLPFDSQAWFLDPLQEYGNAVFVLEAYNLRADEIRQCLSLIERLK
jgi:sugar phosphate isomerase/epimerase